MRLLSLAFVFVAAGCTPGVRSPQLAPMATAPAPTGKAASGASAGAMAAAPARLTQQAPPVAVEDHLVPAAGAAPGWGPLAVEAQPEPASEPKPAERSAQKTLVSCGLYASLYARLEASPRSADFDGAARAFDRAARSYDQKRFVDAALDFMEAGRRFFAAGDVSDRRWAYRNAASAWERAGQVERGRAALIAAAAGDEVLGSELRVLARDLRLCSAGG